MCMSKDDGQFGRHVQIQPWSWDWHLAAGTRRLVLVRLAAIDGVGGNTGVKPQHQLRHLPTTALSLTVV